MPEQRRVGVHRVRPVDPREQRQVVARVGIEGRAGQRLALLGQPGVEATDLALAVGEGAAGAPGVEAVALLDVDRQHLVHPQPAADGADQEVRRGGDDQQAVAGLAVAFQAAQGVGVDARRYDPRDEILDGAGDLRRGAAGDGRQAEVHVVLHGQPALGIEFHEAAFLVQEGGLLDPAQFGHVAPPEGRAVAVDQGVVEVEEGKWHRRFLVR